MPRKCKLSFISLLAPTTSSNNQCVHKNSAEHETVITYSQPQIQPDSYSAPSAFLRFSGMKPKCISDYAFLEENRILPPLRREQASATLKAVQISAFYNKNYTLHSQVCFGETTTLFQTICRCPAALHGVQQLGFYFCRVAYTAVWQEKFRNSHLFMRAGGVWSFLCPDIHSTWPSKTSQ